MATLTLKNVPEDLVSRLKQEARQNRRSLNQETLMRLERSLLSTPRRLDQKIAALEQLHQKLSSLPPVRDALIEKAKSEGRS
ncbi:MAG: Arc family DNA-binding protein [Acidobacteriota bacterium]